MGKKKHRREQFLKKQRKKIQTQAAITARLNGPEPFWYKFRSEILILLLLGVGLFLIHHFIKLKQKDPLVEQFNQSIPDTLIYQLSHQYPDGFQLVTIAENRFLTVKTSSLPTELKINWKKAEVVKTFSPAELKIRLRYVAYEDALRDLVFVLDRRPGASNSASLAPGVDLTVEYLSEDEAKILMAFGLKKSIEKTPLGE